MSEEMLDEVTNVVNYGDRIVIATRCSGLFELVVDENGAFILVKINLVQKE